MNANTIRATYASANETYSAIIEAEYEAVNEFRAIPFGTYTKDAEAVLMTVRAFKAILSDEFDTAYAAFADLPEDEEPTGHDDSHAQEAFAF